jgi:uncharacterized protein YjbI with pentapeptide repeats
MLVHNTTPFLHGAHACSRRPPQPELSLVVRATLLLGADGSLAIAEALPDQGALSSERVVDGVCVYPGDFADFKLAGEVTLTGRCRAAEGERSAVQLRVGSWEKTVPATGGAAVRELGPIDPTSREKLRGRAYGGSYKKTRAPWYAEDFDWAYFFMAPEEQRLKGYLRGDEELAFMNLHPAAPALTCKLPGKRVRAFLEDRAGSFRELDMRLDTLHCDLDASRLYLAWRGVEAVQEDDLDDVAYLLVAAEELAEAAKETDHYRGALEAFKADPSGAKSPVPPELLELQRRAGLDRRDAGVEPNPVSAVLAQKLGDLRKDEQDQIAETLGRAMTAAGDRSGELADKMRAIATAEEPLTHTALPRKPGLRPDARLRPLMRKLLENAGEVRKAADAEGVPAAIAARLRQRAEELERAPHEPRLRELDPDYLPPLEPLSIDEPGPGANLAERDFSRADLAGRDLSGANLEMAILAGANLRGANLQGANLHKAMLYRADLTGADLRGARLSRADLAEVSAEGARFDGADLDGACLEGARLAKANLRGVRGEYQACAGADLRGADARGASFAHADFARAELGNATLSGAKLAGAVLSGCKARGVDLRDADLAGVALVDADLARASLCGANAPKSVWSGANLDDADLGYTRLAGAQLDKVSACRADFTGADWRHGRACRARFDGARFDRANLFQADLRKARLDQVRFVGASLYGAQLVGAHGKGADFTDAVLTRSSLEDA